MQEVLVSIGIQVSLFPILNIKKEGISLLRNLTLPNHLDIGC